jgi:4-hydroxythreonine-4-phosphate dehydrogenase
MKPHHTTLPLLAITMGDPAGVGPEIAARALADPSLSTLCRAFVVGELAIMEKAAELVAPGTPLYSLASPGELVEGAINVLNMHQLDPDTIPVGRTDAACGKASYEYILSAIHLAREGQVDGVVTGPINKESLSRAGIPFPGHTEIFAHETGTEDFTMMFMQDRVAVVHVTTHCSLLEAIAKISTDRVLNNIRLLHRALLELGLSAPRIAVGGLNPHAGEHGLFGTEEIEHIAPAITRAQSEGIDASGPYPPDTVFMRAFKGEFDGVVAMLHDHGFVALKSRDFERGVNITVGLPIVRTSVGHGTAFDIAWKGKASEQSLLEALRVAARMAAAKMQRG